MANESYEIIKSPAQINKLPSGEEDKAEIGRLERRIESLEDELKKTKDNMRLLEIKSERLEEENNKWQSNVRQANTEAMRWGGEVKSLTEDANLGVVLAQVGRKDLALAKLYSALGNMTFLSPQNRGDLSKQLNILEKEDHERFIRPLQDISTLCLQAKTDFQKYNKNYIAYVEGLTWWQRIWRNHGQSGISRAYRSYYEMTRQFEKIQCECNEELAKMLVDGQQDFSQLYANVQHRLIQEAEQQLMEMRRNYFDSSNLNPHSYATYLIHYISRLKEKQPSEQSKIQGEQLLEQGEIANVVEEPLHEQSKTVIIDDTSYQPLFSKEKIKTLYEKFKNEYEKIPVLNSCN